MGPPATVAPRPPVIAVSVKRVQGFSIVGNVVAGSPNVGFETIAASGRIAGNYMRGVGAGTIIAAGYPASPSKVVFVGNRSIQNRNGGILLNGSSTGLMELGDLLEAEITGNDLSHSTVQSGTGFGVRVYSIRRDRADPGGMQSVGNIHALIRANLLVGNDMGVSVDAGFPYRAVGTSCDTRRFSGTTRLEFKGNTISGSRVTSGLITFTRQGAAINPAQLAQWQYFHGGTFTVTDPDGTLASAWIDHPEFDPFIGPCADDVTMEPLRNTLIYNGREVARGTVTVPGR